MTVEELEIVIKANVTEAMKDIEKLTKAMKTAVTESIKPMEKVANKSKAIAQSSVNSFKPMINSMSKVRKSIVSTTAQQQLLIDKINRYKRTLATEDQLPANLRMSDEEALQLRADIEKLEAELNGLQTSGNKSSKTLEKGFKSVRKTVKRFALGLLSVRSAISLISKGMRSYLATNELANKQYELTTNILGQVLAPAMEKLLDYVQYLTIGIATLIKMFTGFDALAKVTTEDLASATDNAEELNKQLTSMDEITNLSEGTDASTSLASDYDALLEFEKKVAEVQQLFEDWKIQEFVDKIKEMSEWLWDNRDAVIAVGAAFALIFSAGKIAIWLGRISSVLGTAGASGVAGAGLIGLGTALLWVAGIAAAGILVAITVKGLYSALQDLGKLNDAISDNVSIAQKLNQLTGTTITTVGGAVRSGDYDAQTYAENLRSSITRQLQIIEGLEKSKTIFNIGSWGETNEAIESYEKQIDAMRQELRDLGYGQYAVPQFANGGVLKEPTYGLMGEYPGANSNPEIVSPQNIMRETFLDAMATVLPSLQSSNNNGDVILNVNGQEFARATYSDYQNESNRRNASTSITVS